MDYGCLCHSVNGHMVGGKNVCAYHGRPDRIMRLWWSIFGWPAETRVESGTLIPAVVAPVDDATGCPRASSADPDRLPTPTPGTVAERVEALIEQEEKGTTRMDTMGNSTDILTAPTPEAAPTPASEVCRRCSELKAKHLRVEDPTDVLAPHILICPTATFEEKAWYDK
jgi:hypothetical protein